MTKVLFFLVFGFLVAVITTPWIIRLAHGGVGMDVPDESRKRQALPVPRLGGIPLMLALALGIVMILLLEPPRLSEWFPILVGTVMMYGLGLWDDVQPLGAKKKLAGQIAIASVVTFLGLNIEKFSLPWIGTVE